MGAVELVIILLEKVSVLIATALVLVLVRPASDWLGVVGAPISKRRQLFIVSIFSVLATWGVFLGFEAGGLGFNIRSMGVIVAGYLGGVGPGAIVGAIAGGVYAAITPPELAPFVFAASIINGVVAGLWVRRYGISLASVALGAVIAQLVHHVTLGALYLLVDPGEAFAIASNVGLHAAKIGANAVGASLFMSLLGLAREVHSARADIALSQAEVRAARLEALQYQLQPHFLFNVLNTLSYLIRTNPARARALTLELADFLRYVLARQDDETSLAEELRQIERYVDLERARFGDGLSFSVETPDSSITERLFVPPMILQPLVENAIKHGARDGEVAVELRVDLEDEDVVIRVLDDGPGPDDHRDPNSSSAWRATRARRGVGLQNARERLERYFHGQATLKLRRRPGSG
ncbi:MAG: histidine kinase, partial [Myxococcota bacterium]